MDHIIPVQPARLSPPDFIPGSPSWTPSKRISATRCEIDHFVEFDDVPDESEDFYNMVSQRHDAPDIIEDSACLLGQIESLDN